MDNRTNAKCAGAGAGAGAAGSDRGSGVAQQPPPNVSAAMTYAAAGGSEFGATGGPVHLLFCTGITPCYHDRAATGPHFVPGLPHVVAHYRRPSPYLGFGVLFNSMIYPFAVGPMALTSFICE